MTATLAEASAALDAGDPATALRVLLDLTGSRPDAPGDALLLLAKAQMWMRDYGAAAHTTERAYRTFIGQDDHAGAAAAAINLVSLVATKADWATARGWETRARRHVEALGPCLERGYLAMAWVACDISDPGELMQRAEEALEVARQFKDHDLELRAHADQGLALVSQGRIDESFALLDEVMLALAAGEIADPVWRCKTFCPLMTACERAGDEGRAVAWTEKVESSPFLQEMDWATTDCLVAGGAVDALSGRWESAEARLGQALEAVAAAPHHRAAAAARLAEFRIQQGRYGEAAGLLQPHAHRLEAAAAIARLRMVEGEYAKAAALLRTAVRSLGSDVIRRAPLLALLVELELRRGDVPAAQRASRRLQALEEGCGSNEIRALARLGSARLALAAGDAEAAIDDLETALALLLHRDLPLLQAQVRLELGRALAQAGEPASAGVEAGAALEVFNRLGVVPDAKTAHDLLSQVTEGEGSRRAAPRGPRGPGLTPREEEVARLVAAGLSNKEVASRLFLSVRTVESHVDRVLGKLDLRSRTQLAAFMNASSLIGSRP